MFKSTLFAALLFICSQQCVLSFLSQRKIVILPSSKFYTQSMYLQNSPLASSQSKRSSNLFSNSESSKSYENIECDPVIKDVATRLRRVNWFSWWSQVILTVISSITLLFARSVLNALSSTMPSSAAPGGFIFAGSGIVLSYLSIIWTWGGTRLSRRLSRNATKNYSRIKSATMIRRAIVIGVTLNLLGMLVTLIGAEQIIGLLAAKVLTMQGISPFQTSFGLGGVGAAGGLGAQTVQPLDVLIVQANTNTLLSHFMSLVCGLILTRSVHVLDPPSVEDDER